MPVSGSAMRGVYAVLPTPFTQTDQVDGDGLRSSVDFCVEAGADGLVVPVVASEFTALTDDERRLVAEVVIDSAAGRLPVVVGVSGTSTAHAVAFSAHARSAGASAVIALPPYVRRADRVELRQYYEAIAAAAEVPVFVQDYIPPIGTPMAAASMLDLVHTIEGVDYIKEETALAPQVMSELIANGGSALRGVMGGMAGRNLVQEHQRGSCGTMPACEFIDVHVAVWGLLEQGDVPAARQLLAILAPLLLLESLLGSAMVKEVLMLRGLLRSARVRGPGVPTLDAHDRLELRAALAPLAGLWRLAEPRTTGAAR